MATKKKAVEPVKETLENLVPGANALKVLMVGSECAPFSKTGGLADVMSTLPPALQKQGVDCRVMIPFHSKMKEKYATQTTHIADFYIQMGWRREYVGVELLHYQGVDYYLIDNNYYFGGPIYKGGTDEGMQYAYFQRAVLEAMEYIDFEPDVMHCNDWQTGMIPMLIKTQYQFRKQGKYKTLLTIHNIMYQGKYDFGFVKDLLHIPDMYCTPEYIENYGCANFLKAGLVFADKINTVSPTYAKELLSPYFAYELEGILAARENDTVGIINGINPAEYDPATDKLIPYNFSAKDLAGKEECKKALLAEMGLEYKEGRPVIGLVSRLTAQKGFDLIMRVIHDIMRLDIAIVLLGSGDAKYESFFRSVEQTYPGRFCAYIGYSNELSHKIYAGCDLFLMPSVFEPCGISQMIALCYGTLPIVRETGGLKDTVQPYNQYTGEGNGFSFANVNAHDMLHTIEYAVEVLKDKEAHNTLVQNAFASDFAFEKSAKLYKELFESL